MRISTAINRTLGPIARVTDPRTVQLDLSNRDPMETLTTIENGKGDVCPEETLVARLQSGQLDAATVSVLMGHRDTTMISRHYSHLAQRLGHLRDAARKARGAGA